MPKQPPVLLIDCHCLGYRAHHSTGGLRAGEGGPKTGVLFGFFRELKFLAERFQSDQFAFFFDGGSARRREIYPGYKLSRRTRNARDPASQEAKNEVRRQVKLLQTDYLPRLGYANLFHQPGYEADDLIAAAAGALNRRPQECVIVSTDKDLWQCLISDRVRCYNPVSKKAVSRHDFIGTWGIVPGRWPEAKAVAGCESDDVPGLPGVKERTACKYLADAESVRPGVRKLIAERVKSRQYAVNLELCRLPMAGAETPWVRPQKPVKESAWNDVMAEAGIKTLDAIRARVRKPLK